MTRWLVALRSWIARRSTRETDGGVWLSLLVATLVLLPNTGPRSIVVLHLLLLFAALVVSLRWRVGPFAVAVLLVVGLGLRTGLFGAAFSDVLRVTIAAIDQVAGGGNPYGSGYSVTNPPGSPFAYGPLTLVWYLPFRADPRVAEMFAATLILVALALRGRLLGLAIYAATPALVTTASDGSNDTTAGLLLLIALVVATRQPRTGALLLAVAVAFKPYAAAWLPALWAWAGGGVLVAFAVGFLITWGPALLVWGPGNVLESYALAERIHSQSYYSLAYALEGYIHQHLSADLFARLRLLLGGALALLSLPLVRSAAAMIVAGAVVYLATLFTGFWSTHAYVAAVAPVICWYLDQWLGLSDQRVRLPGDPVGRLERALDHRWPPMQQPGVGIAGMRRGLQRVTGRPTRSRP